jgi:hypothetical protein
VADDRPVEPSLPPGAIEAEDELVRSSVGLLRLSSLYLLVFGPLMAAVGVVGFWLAVGSLPLGALTTVVTYSFVVGVAVGAMTSRRKRVKNIDSFPPSPFVAARLSVALRSSVLEIILGVLVMAVVFGALVRSSVPAVAMVVMGSAGLGHVLCRALSWMPAAIRAERRTKCQILRMDIPGTGPMKQAIALSAARPAVEAAVSRGDFGTEGSDWARTLQRSLHVGGWYDEAAALGDQLYARSGDPADAYNTARSVARSGDHDLAAEYLVASLRGGHCRDGLIDERDLRPLLPRPDVIEAFKATKPVATTTPSDVVAPPLDGLGEGGIHWRREQPEDVAGGG